MKKISVIRWAAVDGSLHETEKGAVNRDNYLKRVGKIRAVRSVLEHKVRNHHFSALSDTLFPYDGWQKVNEFDQDRFLDQLAELIIDSLSDITETYVRGE